MTESTVTISITCWKNRLSGLAAIYYAKKVAGGETCPNDDQWKDVVVDLSASETEIQEAATNQLAEKCALCGLKPQPLDFRI